MTKKQAAEQKASWQRALSEGRVIAVSKAVGPGHMRQRKSTEGPEYGTFAWRITQAMSVLFRRNPVDSNKSTRTYEMSLPTKLADQLDSLSKTLQVTQGEAVSRALQLLSHAVSADKVTLVKGNQTTDVQVK